MSNAAVGNGLRGGAPDQTARQPENQAAKRERYFLHNAHAAVKRPRLFLKCSRLCGDGKAHVLNALGDTFDVRALFHQHGTFGVLTRFRRATAALAITTSLVSRAGFRDARRLRWSIHFSHNAAVSSGMSTLLPGQNPTIRPLSVSIVLKIGRVVLHTEPTLHRVVLRRNFILTDAA